MNHPYSQEALFTSKLEQRIVFFLVSVGVVTLTYGFFYLIDFLPETPETKPVMVGNGSSNMPIVAPGASTTPATVAAAEDIAPLPTKIFIDALDKEIAVLNPESRSVSALDTALLSGVVRHPDSADFVRTGTIFILGHSSYLPNVVNKNFQAFNGIQKLTWGDTIRLHSADTEYVYRVERVYEAKASDAEVEIRSGESRLTLATCNSFGTKDDRFVVEASLVGKHAL